MVRDQLIRKNLNINVIFFFFYNSFISKSTGLKMVSRVLHTLRLFRWLFFFQLRSILHLYLSISKRFERINNTFNWIANRKTIRFYNEGIYRRCSNSFKIFKFHLLSSSKVKWELERNSTNLAILKPTLNYLPPSFAPTTSIFFYLLVLKISKSF
jgi:hypothetical protein